MSRYKFLFLCFGLLFLSSCSSDPSIVGTWEMAVYNGMKMSGITEKTTITFNQDGTLIHSMGNNHRKGKWEFQNDGKSVVFISEEGTQDIMDNIEITEKTLSFTDRGTEIILQKSKP